MSLDGLLGPELELTTISLVTAAVCLCKVMLSIWYAKRAWISSCCFYLIFQFRNHHVWVWLVLPSMLPGPQFSYATINQIVQRISSKFWPNRSLCDRSVKVGMYVLSWMEIHIRSWPARGHAPGGQNSTSKNNRPIRRQYYIIISITYVKFISRSKTDAHKDILYFLMW